MSRDDSKPADKRCDWCQKTADEVQFLIIYQDRVICCECVRLFADLLDEAESTAHGNVELNVVGPTAQTDRTHGADRPKER